MKKLILVLLLLTAFLAYHVKAQLPVDRAVRCEVTIVNNTTLKLEWLQNQYATGYQIFRRKKGETSWGNVLKSLDKDGSEYIDTDVQVGEIYEYRILRLGSGNFRGYGYVLAGIDVDPIQFGQRVLLIIEKGLHDNLGQSLDTLQTDLAMSGFNVELLTVDMSKDAQFVKSEIEKIDKQGSVDAIYIMGHVAVPYSGLYCADFRYTVPPDGHGPGQGNHCGAWPADVYYGVKDGLWTDVDSTTYGTRTATANRIGDGKFDQIEIPGKVELATGRVDFYNLPVFSKDELALTKQYIQKIHNYKNNNLVSYNKGLVDDNFKSFAESFSSTGWRNFTSMFGRDQVFEQDFFTTVKDSTYMFAMLDGAGSYTSCNGVGTSSDYAKNNSSAMFNFTFGSFFGNWDVKNNLLRCGIATEKGGLTNAWSGRPWWHAHALALGHDMGYITKLAQNNKTDYYGSAFVNNIHIALMGDPTLRLYPFNPASKVTVTPAADRKSATINWTASTDNNVLGYDIYVSTSKYSYYEKMNQNLITGTSYEQKAAYQGTNYYMVRASKMETTPSGRFVNYSQGALGISENMVGETRSIDKINRPDFTMYPNPSTGKISIYLEFQTKNEQLEVYNSNGALVHNQSLKSQNNKLNINLHHLPKGIYFVKIGHQIERLALN